MKFNDGLFNEDFKKNVDMWIINVHLMAFQPNAHCTVYHSTIVSRSTWKDPNETIRGRP